MLNNLEQIAVLTVVAAEKNFTRAAERLDISKSQVSKIIKALEARLGAQLVQRNTRNMSLTDAGQQYADFGRHILDTLEQADAAIAGFNEQVSGTLRVGISHSFGLRHITPLLCAFQDKYPEIELEVNLFDRRPNLLEEGFDCWLAVNNNLPEGLVARKLMDCKFKLIASPEYLDKQPEILKPEDIKDHKCIIYYSKSRKYNDWDFEKNGEHKLIRVTGNYRVDNAPAILEATKQGMGISFFSTYLLHDELLTGELVEVLPDWNPVLDLPVYVLFPRRQYLAPNVRAFVDFMVEHVDMIDTFVTE